MQALLLQLRTLLSMQPYHLLLNLPPDCSRRLEPCHHFDSPHHQPNIGRQNSIVLFGGQFPANALGTHLHSHGILQRSTRPPDGLHDLHINYAEDAITTEHLRTTRTSKRLEQAHLAGRRSITHTPPDQLGYIDHVQSPTWWRVCPNLGSRSDELLAT